MGPLAPLARRPAALAAALGLGLASAAASVVILPPEHEVVTRFVDAENLVTGSLGAPQPLQPGELAPAAGELVLRDPRRLARLAAASGLFEAEEAARSRWVAAAAARLAAVAGDDDPQARERARLERLDRRLAFAASGEEVTLRLRWADGEAAARFLAAAAEELQRWRADAEVGAVARAVTVLEERVAEAGRAVDAARARALRPPAGPGDPAFDVAQAQLAWTLGRAEELARRLRTARITLEAARAARAGAITVVEPPQAPRAPRWPSWPRALGAGLAGGLALGAVVAAWLERTAERGAAR